MSDPHELRLAQDYEMSIDHYLDMHEKYTAALIRGGDATQERAQVRRAMATFGELIINRADGRTARLLVSLMKQQEEIAARIAAMESRILAALGARVPDDERDHGHDEIGRPPL